MKKYPLLGLSLVLSLSALFFFSCQKKPAVDMSDPNYPINISIFSMATHQQPPADNKIYKWMKDEFNVEFTWDIAVGQKDQKMGVMIASGDYPDLLDIDGRKFYEAGALIPLDDLIEEYAPNLKRHYAEAWEKMKEDDGKVYALPIWGVLEGIDQSPWYGDSAMWIQKEVLKEFGYPTVKTVDEYFDLIIRYKEKYPTINGMPTIGFTICTYDWLDFCLVNPPNFLAGFPNDGNGTIDPITHEYKVSWYQDISKQWFKKLNELNAKGLIDRTCFVDNYDQYLAKLSSGRVLGFHDQAWNFQSSQYSLQNQGIYNRTHSPLPIVFDESIRPRYRNQRLPNVGQGIGISVKAKDPVRIIRFLDAQLSEEAQRVLCWGFEGEDWQYDEDGVPYRTDLQREQQKDEVWKLRNKAELWTSHNPKYEGSFSDGYPTNIADLLHERIATTEPEDVELWAAYNVASNAEIMDPDPPENAVWFPAWQIEPYDGSEAQLGLTKAQEVYRKYLPRIILGRAAQFESLWDEYVSELHKAGIGKYEEFMQEKVNERIERWSPK